MMCMPVYSLDSRANSGVLYVEALKRHIRRDGQTLLQGDSARTG